MKLIQSISIFATDNTVAAVTIVIAILFSIGFIIKSGRDSSIRMATFVITIVLSVIYVAAAVIGLLYAPSLSLTNDGQGAVIFISFAYIVLLFWLSD
jgi:hypothetical protein